MMQASSALDAQVRAADPDRWLSSRFVSDPDARTDLIALYAFEAELAAIPGRVSQPLLAEMRLTWWAEQMDGVFSGAPRKGHPVLEALSMAVVRRGLDRSALEAVIDARVEAVHGADEDILALYIDPMRQAARILTGQDHPEIADAARVWAAGRAEREGEARELRRRANAALARLPAQAFPAVAHAALIRRSEPSSFKRLRLIWAVARGRI